MRTLTQHGLAAIVFIGLLFVASPVNAGESGLTDAAGRTSLFAGHSPLTVTIEAPLTTLMRDRPEEAYLDGLFSYASQDGTAYTFDLKIRARGNFRLQESTCDFAPIRLNFRKKQVAGTEFDNQDKLKLVTHCQSGTPYYEQLALREYLAYRFLQVLTDKSFGTRLMKINYVDTDTDNTLTRVGFVIEDHDDVAARNGMTAIERGDTTHDDLDRQQENLVNVFQYLIGNTDYSLIKGPEGNCCHNARLMSATDGPPYTVVPYDFDFAGIVNAPYATTDPEFRLRSVRQRLYRGLCKNNDLLPGTLKLFTEKKEAIYGILDEIEFLSSRTRADVTAYLDGFYKSISSPKLVRIRLTDACSGSS
ncbi:MAG: hypothetical protein O3A13_09025 [Proteobacteria bacterium]|nr:hypothetical protein [Pseudomonadota bacterium]